MHVEKIRSFVNLGKLLSSLRKVFLKMLNKCIAVSHLLLDYSCFLICTGLQEPLIKYI